MVWLAGLLALGAHFMPSPTLAHISKSKVCDFYNIQLRCIIKKVAPQKAQTELPCATKTNQEIAAAIRPDQMLNYMASAEELHRLGRNAAMYSLLSKASALDMIAKKEVTELSPKRQKILSTVNRWARSACFRHQVLTAYGNRCSVTRMQLRLVEAAHILPVEADETADDVRNGIALSPTYHRAFDGGLIYLDDDYVMKINLERELQLVTLNLDGGINDFRRYLGMRIYLPPDKRQWPDISMIRKANKYRRISQ